mgnify:FL=1
MTSLEIDESILAIATAEPQAAIGADGRGEGLLPKRVV